MKRPLKFEEVIGQEIAVKLIQNGLKTQKLPRSIILYGSSGIGKTTLARLIAASSFCLERIDEEVCGICSMCQGVQNGSLPDLLEFDAASHTSVEDIREILELCNYAPQFGLEKVFIIDEAHMLSRSAISALLKTLEEAKEGVRFILATTELDKISSAIKSRCFCIPLKDLGEMDIEKCIKNSAKEYNIIIDDESVKLITEISYGSMREGLSVFFRAHMYENPIKIENLKKILSYVDEVQIETLAHYIKTGDYAKLYEFLQRMRQNENLVGISLVRQLLSKLKKDYEQEKNVEIIEIIIELNKLQQETTKASFFNEMAIIGLSEIAYNIAKRINKSWVK